MSAPRFTDECRYCRATVLFQRVPERDHGILEAVTMLSGPEHRASCLWWTRAAGDSSTRCELDDALAAALKEKP